MKKAAVLLIVFGSGLAAFGILGLSGEISPNTNLTDPVRTQSPVYGALDGSLGWPINDRIEVTLGIIFLVGGLIIRKDSN